MAKNQFFTRNVDIQLQGEKTLRFISVDESAARYHIIGFDNPTITIVDRRSTGLKAIHSAIESGDVSGFPLLFNTPARGTIHFQDGKISEIVLSNPKKHHHKYRLWIAIGKDWEIPVYDYKCKAIEELPDGSMALVSLYKIRN